MPKPKPKYPDHIFGDVEKPPKSLKVYHQRNAGVHHWDRVTVDPAQEQALFLQASTDSRLSVASVQLIWSLDDWETTQVTAFHQIGQRWDSILWAWLKDWQVTVRVEPESVLRYQVYANLSDGSLVFADNQASNTTKATQFAHWSTSSNQAPAWSRGARIYQVFVDRFNPGMGREWLQTADLRKPFGGTIKGVTEKLDHIQALGFNTVWLSPVFRSPSHHGYDISDYFAIEPRFGSQADLEALIEEAHQRGMRVLLDFVANHCSDAHPGFVTATQNENDPHHAWFHWKRWPKRYQSFYEVPSMPQLNLRYGSPARQHLLEAARYWLKLGVDGYRLDYANGPDREFWVDFQRACLEINPQAWTFGEVVAPVDEQVQLAGSMHGTLDFLTCQMIRQTFATRERSLAELGSYLQASGQGFPPGFSRPAFIDNHDMNRFLFTAEEDLTAFHAALRLLYLLPQPPIVYYGTEFGLSQAQSIHDRGAVGFDEARMAMPWKDRGEASEGRQILEARGSTAELLRELAEFREANPWLLDAEWQVGAVSEDGNEVQLRMSSHENALIVTLSLTDGRFAVQCFTP